MSYLGDEGNVPNVVSEEGDDIIYDCPLRRDWRRGRQRLSVGQRRERGHDRRRGRSGGGAGSSDVDPSATNVSIGISPDRA
jgi:hypothetical protein